MSITVISKLKALVVDDDDFQLDILMEALKAAGILSVDSAISGELALGKLTGVDILVLDLHMPGMDGFQFMEALSQRGFKGGLIIVSGQSSEVIHGASLVSRLRRFKLLGVLPKPVSPESFATLIRQYAGG